VLGLLLCKFPVLLGRTYLHANVFQRGDDYEGDEIEAASGNPEDFNIWNYSCTYD